jgi:aminopeptidase C
MSEQSSDIEHPTSKYVGRTYFQILDCSDQVLIYFYRVIEKLDDKNFILQHDSAYFYDKLTDELDDQFIKGMLPEVMEYRIKARIWQDMILTKQSVHDGRKWEMLYLLNGVYGCYGDAVRKFEKSEVYHHLYKTGNFHPF